MRIALIGAALLLAGCSVPQPVVTGSPAGGVVRYFALDLGAAQASADQFCRQNGARGAEPRGTDQQAGGSHLLFSCVRS